MNGKTIIGDQPYKFQIIKKYRIIILEGKEFPVVDIFVLVCINHVFFPLKSTDILGNIICFFLFFFTFD